MENLEADVTEHPAWATACLNCRHELHGPFCSYCGQRALPPHPTLAELTADAYQELVGWDGKVLHTLRTLLTRPGEATRTMLDGQRARYIPPFRLYLLCSVIYFVAASATVPPDISEMRVEVGVGIGRDDTVRTPDSDALLKALAYRLDTLSPEEREAAEREIARQPRIFQPLLRTIAVDYAGFRRRVAEIMPRALFLLIPVLAAILGMFHRRRRYADHLYFSLHFQTVVFVALTVPALFSYGAPFELQVTAQGVAVAWILVYAVLAQRRVYGGSWGATILKAVGTGALYSMLWSAISLGIAFWISRGP